jgi:transposase
MPSSAAALTVPPAELAVLRRWASAAQAPATLVRRAKLLLFAAEGLSNTEIAERLGISRPTVIAWRSRYAREGLTGQLADRPRPGRPQTVRRDAWNQRCQPFAWTKDADQILSKLNRQTLQQRKHQEL